MEKKEARELIAKLLALAFNEGATTSEAEVAMAKATSLMTKYMVSEEECRPVGEKATLESAEAKPGTLEQWMGELAMAVSVATGTYVYRHTGNDSFLFSGRPSNVAVAVHLFTVFERAIQLQAVESFKQHAASEKARTGVSFYRQSGVQAIRATWIKSFKIGAPKGYAAIVAKAQQQEQTANSMALVVVGNARKEAELWVKQSVGLHASKLRHLKTEATAFSTGVQFGASLTANKALN